MMGISRTSAYALVKRKEFPHIFVGNRIVIPSDLFNEWVSKTAMDRRYR
jgi:excisionase family DNA binding protein